MYLDHRPDDIQVSLEELLNGIHRCEFPSEEKIHHAGFDKIVQMMAQSYLPEATPVGYFKQDTAPVPGADIAVVVIWFRRRELRLIYYLEIDVEILEILLEAGSEGLFDGMLDPVYHDAMESVGNRKPLSAYGEGHGKGQRILPARDAQEDVFAVSDHVEVIDAFPDILDEAHDPRAHVAFDDVEV